MFSRSERWKKNICSTNSVKRCRICPVSTCFCPDLCFVNHLPLTSVWAVSYITQNSFSRPSPSVIGLVRSLYIMEHILIVVGLSKVASGMLRKSFFFFFKYLPKRKHNVLSPFILHRVSHCILLLLCVCIYSILLANNEILRQRLSQGLSQ